MNDYNHIRQWLIPQLDRIQMSIEQFARRCKISRAAIYFYLDDKYRPTTGTMAKMCAVLGIPLEEGLRQYTERKPGRPTHKAPQSNSRVIGSR